MKGRALATLAACWALTGCTYSVHQASVGGFEPAEPLPANVGATRVSAEAEQFVILAITPDTSFADEAYQKLLAQCPSGQLVGVLARHSTDHGPLSYTNRLKLEATCLAAPGR